MKRSRKNHSPAFKAKVAMEALKNENTLAELSQKYQVHSTQIQQWKKQLQQQAEVVFARGSTNTQIEDKSKELYEKIGQLTMERDFLSEKLDR